MAELGEVSSRRRDGLQGADLKRISGSIHIVRFVIAVVVVILLGFAGLYVYGLTLKPNTHTIEQDAVGSANA